VLLEDVGREPLEVGPGIRLLRDVTAVLGMAAAVLPAQQLLGALVELVVADAANVQP
jgi:hypothetical protein